MIGVTSMKRAQEYFFFHILDFVLIKSKMHRSTTPDAGLFLSLALDELHIDEAPSQVRIQLKKVNVEAQITGCVATVHLTQIFENIHPEAAQARYVFPLDHKAAVTRFQVEYNGNTFHAQLKEKKQAIRDYRRAVKQGKFASLLKEDLGDVFSMELGNIPGRTEDHPSTLVTVSLSYVTELVMKVNAESVIRFVLPTTVAPRYTPHGMESLSSSSGVETDHTALTVRIRSVLSGKVQSVECPTHKIVAVSQDEKDNSTLVQFAANEAHLGQDLVINYVMESLENMFYVEQDKKNSSEVYMMCFAHRPIEEKKDVAENEYIFILDRSGSMDESMDESITSSKTKMNCVHDLMQLAFQSLPVDCTFNIVSFASDHNFLWKESKPYNDATVELAREYMRQCRATGGTEILPPLLQVFKKDLPKGCTTIRNIIILTDGQVSNVDEIIRHIHRTCNESEVRIFTIGVGSEPSREILTKMAWRGGGLSRFALDESNLNSIMTEIIGYTLCPNVTRVNLEWAGSGKIGLEQYNSSASAYERHCSILYVRKPIDEKEKEGDDNNCLYQLQLHRPESNIPVTLKVLRKDHRRVIGQQDTMPLHALFAKQCVAECLLENSESSKKKMIETSMRYNILSRETAFIMVDRDGKATPSSISPIVDQSEESYHAPKFKGLGGGGARRAMCRSAPSFPPDALFGGFGGFDQSAELAVMEPSSPDMKKMDQDLGEYGDCDEELEEMEEESVRTFSKSVDSRRPLSLLELISLQKTIGWFDGSSSLWQSLSKEKDLREEETKLLEHFRQAFAYALKTPNIASTVHALLLLRLRFLPQFNQWKLLAEKAKKWLRKQSWDGVSDGSHVKLIDAL